MIKIVDDFCPAIEAVIQSAHESGFGKWAPNKGEVGSSIYEGMNFWGRHSLMLASLSSAIGLQVFPNSMFFRVTNKGFEKAYIHSDRESGSLTCVAYLSQHNGITTGTGFFRHKRTGLREMPSFQQMQEAGILDEMKKDMVEGDEAKWDLLDFVAGLYNRAVIFHAPLFHSRFPKEGIGTTEKDGRLVWVCHFEVMQ